MVGEENQHELVWIFLPVVLKLMNFCISTRPLQDLGKDSLTACGLSRSTRI